MKAFLRKATVVILSAVMVFSSVVGTVPVMAGKSDQTGGRKQTYLVQAVSEQKLAALDQVYEESETVSELGEDSMKEDGFTALELTEKQAERLEKDHRVAIVEPDIMVQASSKKGFRKKTAIHKKVRKGTEWNLQAIRCDKKKEKKSGKNKVRVALIDSGVDLFNDISVKESINLIPGEEEVLPLFWDTSGHGTSIAGILAAEDNGEGITGIDPDVELYSARVLDENKSAPVSRIIEALYWAIEKRVDIISLSFGTTFRSEGLETAIRKAHEEGILIVAAAGNNGVIEYPAAMEEVMAVGGTDTNGTVCDYSARGKEVEIVAPAEQIKATGGFDGTVICNGTSMAVPHVVGVAARLWEKDREKSADFIRQLIDTAANPSGERNGYGNGLVDYEQALAVYDEFEKSYKSWRTVEQNGAGVEENDAPVQEFINVDYVNGSWCSTPPKNRPKEKTHGTIADYALKKNNITVTNASDATTAKVITMVKKGAVYPDAEEHGLRGMTKHPCLHGYFKNTSGKAVCNYVSNYIQCTRSAKEIRGGAMLINPTPNAPNNASMECHKLFANVVWGDMGRTAYHRAAFAYGVAIHTATDVFAHSVWTKKYGRLFHEVNKSEGKTNEFADWSSVIPERFETAKDVAVNILAHFNNNTIGTPEDFCKSSNYSSEFALYNFSEYLKEAGAGELAGRMGNCSKKA